MHKRAATRGARSERGLGSRAPRAGRWLIIGLLAAIAVFATSFLASACSGGGAAATTTAGSTPSIATRTQAGEPPPGSGERPVVKIGALFPVVGDFAAEGQSALRGMRQAVAEVNRAGGIAALGGAFLTVIEGDSKGDPATADDEVRRLVQDQGVAALVGTGQSTIALPATQAAEGLQTPFVVSTGAADEITDRGLTYTFRLCPKTGWYARDQVALLLALKSLAGVDVRSVALLHENGQFGRQTADNQKRCLSEVGIQVVADLEYPAGQADLHEQILQVKASGAQAVLTATFLSDAAVIAKYAQVLRLHVPVVDAAGGVLDPGFVAEAGEAGEDMMTVAQTGPGTAAGPVAGQDLGTWDSALDAAALYGYQAVWLLADALQRARTIDGPPLRSALATTVLSGQHLVLPQGLLTFDESGQNREARLVVLQVQDGRLVTVWPAEHAQGKVRLP